MIELLQGDCRERMRELAEASVDSIVTDPPYGLEFMGKAWDRGVPGVEFWSECLRVLKPGGHMLAFSGTRTYHRMVCAIEDSGFEIRDQLAWVYGSGFPKSHNGEWGGTALKPAWEPIVLARKPLIGTVEENWREHGTGALNIDGCRIEAPDGVPLFESRGESRSVALGDGLNGSNRTGEVGVGRWPANLIHDGSDEVVSRFPQTTSGVMRAGTVRAAQDEPGSVCFGTFGGNATSADTFGDTGSAARFFYCAKADREDRDEGLGTEFAKKALNWSSGEQNPGSFQSPNTDRSARNFHPTVKPTDLMRWLVRLVTPKGGIVLDPFMGSGSTGKAAMLEGFRFIGIDLSPEYIEIARARIEFARRQGHQPSLLEAA